MNRSYFLTGAAPLAALAFALVADAEPIRHSFLYQGQLKEGGRPFEGLADVQFKLVDEGPGHAQVGQPLVVPNVSVTAGLFTVRIDFANAFGIDAFNGNARLLEVAVRRAGVGALTPLAPLQPLLATPYALHSVSAHSLSASDGSPSGVVTVDVNGNVGIGTTVPLHKLDVTGNVNAAGTIGSRNAVTIDGMSRSIISDGDLSLLTNAQNRMFISHVSGNVGIGNTAPGQKLDVAGSFIASGFIASGTNGITIDGLSRSINGDGSLVLRTNQQTRVHLDGSGNVGIGNPAPAQKLDVLGNIHSTGTIASGDSITIDGSARTIHADGDLSVQTTAGTSIFIDDPSGNVGIGTLTPGARLDVRSATAATAGRVLTANSTANTWLMLYSGFGDGSSDPAILWSDDVAGDALRFLTANVAGANGTERMRINGSNGHVGIGTTSPDSRLEVAGQVISSGSPGGAFTILNPNNPLALAHWDWFNDVARLRVGGSGNGATNGLDFQTVSNRSLLRLLSNGNVGVNTTSPAATLHVAGDARIDGGLSVNGIAIGTDSPIFSAHVHGTAEPVPEIGCETRTEGIMGVSSECCYPHPDACDGTPDHWVFLDAFDLISQGPAVRFGPALSFMHETGVGHFGATEVLNLTSAGAGVNGDLVISDGLRVNGDSGGNVTLVPRVVIGTTSPSAFELYVLGDAAKPGGGGWTAASDLRRKKGVRTLSGALAKLLSLRGVTFEYVDPASPMSLPGAQIGMIAQEVETVFPQWVSEDGEGYKYVTVRGFEALVVEAIREIRDQFNANPPALQNELDAVRKENALLRERLDDLGARLARLEKR